MHEDVLRRSRRLPQWAALAVAGADAQSFLQGQLSADLTKLAPDSVLLASVNSPQGRVQDVVWIAPRGDNLLLLTRADLLDATEARLKKYVLRAKVKIERPALDIAGMDSDVNATAWTAPLSQSQSEELNIIHWPGGRTLVIHTAGLTSIDDGFVFAWDRTDVACGLPSIAPPTHELFVAQMLNLDVLGGIDFEKGCYTGQEIIARTHFRGSVKRRMFRYQANCPPPPLASRLLADGNAVGEVVSSAATPNGCEFLAVVQLAQIGKTLTLDADPTASVSQLEFPYSLPITSE